mgnify:CR=1 FL=1
MNEHQDTQFEIAKESSADKGTFYAIQRIGTPEQYNITASEDGVSLNAVFNVHVSTETPVEPEDITDLPPDVLSYIQTQIGDIQS